MPGHGPNADAAAAASTSDPLADRAVSPIQDGMTVGLGTGRAATRGIHALARRIAEQGWTNIRCVATSKRSAELAGTLGLRIVEMEHVPQVDFLFDGADEVAPNLMMLKGRGGAMTREKIVAEAAVHRVYLIDRSKLVERIGERHRLPIEVLAYARASLHRRLEHLGLEVSVRPNSDDDPNAMPYRTDEGNLVFDCAGLPAGGDWAAQLRSLERAITDLPGVVDHGLFLSHADRVLVEDPDTRDVEELERVTRGPSS